ncbi:MAG: squalene/phytoene synthase family protein [Paracoccaceae bacterium]
MSLDTDVIACAQIVEKGDPDRFRTVMAAQLSERPVLFPLYAFNIEISRAPWVTQEPMIAEMRLQWWRDALEEIAQGGPVRQHEVTTPLSRFLTRDQAKLLDEAVALRRWDVYKEPFDDQAHFDDYVDATAGHLMWTAASQLGARDEAPVRALAFGAGVATFLRAIPTLESAGRVPLLDGTHDGIRMLAARALARSAQGRIGRNPALWPAIGARHVLQQVIKDPAAVGEGRLAPPLTAFRLIWTKLTGRG